ncbi:hypothetical protein AB4Y85_05165 [Microvirga sp. 2YAF29]|uniref:hypothetical protein n=1 Tax=Microvirga sp. 2YAF29 TaxID=3233031 RepID=UPI003F9CE167
MRDLLMRIIYGASNLLLGSFVTVSVGLVVGPTLILIASTPRGRTNAIIMQGIDVLLLISQLFLSLSILILLGL